MANWWSGKGSYKSGGGKYGGKASRSGPYGDASYDYSGDIGYGDWQGSAAAKGKGGKANLSVAKGSRQGSAKQQCVKMDGAYMRKILRTYAGDEGEVFCRVGGATGDRDVTDPAAMCYRLDRWTEEGYNRPGNFVGFTGANVSAAATSIEKALEVMGQYRDYLQTAEGTRLVEAADYFRRTYAGPRDEITTWNHCQALCETIADQSTHRMFQQLAAVAAKAYVGAMAVLQAKAVLHDTNRLANELQSQVHLLPNEARPFLNDPSDDDHLVTMMASCFEQQVLAKSGADENLLEDDWGAGGGYHGASAAPAAPRGGFGQKRTAENASGSGDPRGFGKKAAAGAGSGLGGKRTNAPEDHINVEDFFDEAKPKVKQEPGDGVAPAAADASGESRAKAAKVTPEFDAAATLEVAKILEQLEDESKTNGTLEDKGMLADIMKKVPAPLRQQTGLPARIDPAAFTEDCKDELAKLRKALDAAMEAHYKKFIANAQKGCLGLMYHKEYAKFGLLAAVHEQSFDFKDKANNYKELLEAGTDEEALTKAQIEFLRSQTDRDSAAALFDQTVAFLLKHGKTQPSVDEIRDFLSTLNDDLREAMGIRTEKQWKSLLIRAAGWKLEVAKRMTFAVLSMKAWQ